MHEFEFINWLRKLVALPQREGTASVGIGDDMAVIPLRGNKLLLGSDLTIENIHFKFSDASPRQVGHKALGRCLSDCAAMAGSPLATIVSVARPASLPDALLKEIFVGLDELAKRYHCPIVGGDTSHSQEGLVIDVCLLGQCEQTEPILRSGAQAGDYLYVTGPLGGSILGKHLTFEPRISEALWLAKHLPLHAMIDLSDGLSSDLWHMCEESRCGAELFIHGLDSIVSDDARRLGEKTGTIPLDHALNDGEDFELLAAIGLSPSELPDLPENLHLHPIGRITDKTDVHILYPTGRQVPIVPAGFRHF